MNGPDNINGIIRTYTYISTVSYTWIVLIVNIQLLLDSPNYNVISLLSTILSIILHFLSILFFSN